MPDLIIERYRAPKHKGVIQNPDLSHKDDNPSCGDHIQIDLLIDNNRIVSNAMFSGQGCSVSIASADLLMEQILGQSLERIGAITKEDFLSSIKLDIPIQRESCAVLPYYILVKCIKENSNK